jgi:hypothetical protein
VRPQEPAANGPTVETLAEEDIESFRLINTQPAFALVGISSSLDTMIAGSPSCCPSTGTLATETRNETERVRALLRRVAL